MSEPCKLNIEVMTSTTPNIHLNIHLNIQHTDRIANQVFTGKSPGEP